MADLVKSVWELYTKLDKESRGFLGGPMYSKNVEREIQNYLDFSSGKIPKRQRISIGIPLVLEGSLIGYSTTTILENANPTKYEKDYIGLNDKLNYLQIKYFLIDKDCWGKKFSDKLLKCNLELAEELKKGLVCDIVSRNKHMKNLLERNGIFEDFKWRNDNNQSMSRMSL